MKLAGLPANSNLEKFEESFLKQAEEFRDFDLKSINKVMKVFLTIDRTHPWTVIRAAESLKWIESGEYQTILEKTDRSVEKKINNQLPSENGWLRKLRDF